MSSGRSTISPAPPRARDHLVVAAAGLEVGGHVVAVEHLHRVLLQAPDAVVADDDHHREPVADERVDVHAG